MALFGDAGEVSQLDVADMRAQVAERSERLLRSGPLLGRRRHLGRRDAGALRGARRVRGRRRGHLQPLDLRPARGDPRGPLRGGPGDAEQPERRDGRRARRRALGQGRARRRAAPLPRPAWWRCSSSTPSSPLPRTASAWRRRSRASAPDRSRRRPATTSRAASSPATRSGSSAARSWRGASPESTLAETMAGIAEGAELLTVIGGRDAPIPLDQMERARARRRRARDARGRPAALLVAHRRRVGGYQPSVPGSPL